MKTTEMEKLRTETFGNMNVYELQFNHENDGRWYIDFPGWPFSHHNLMMVAGADELCAVMSDDDKVAKVNVIPTKKEEKHEGYAHLNVFPIHLREVHTIKWKICQDSTGKYGFAPLLSSYWENIQKTSILRKSHK